MFFNKDDFQNQLYMKIDQINAKLLRVVTPITKELGINPQIAYMLVLIQEVTDCNISMLHKKMCLNQGNVSSMCKKMETAGYIIRKRKKEDERVVNLYLTPKGNDLLLALYDRTKKYKDIVDNMITEEQKESVLMGMDNLSMIFDVIENGGSKNA